MKEGEEGYGLVRERGQPRQQARAQAPAQHAQLALAVAVVALHLLVLALDLGDHAAQPGVLHAEQLEPLVKRQPLASAAPAPARRGRAAPRRPGGPLDGGGGIVGVLGRRPCLRLVSVVIHPVCRVSRGWT